MPIRREFIKLALSSGLGRGALEQNTDQTTDSEVVTTRKVQIP